jgi:hypothetical protein
LWHLPCCGLPSFWHKRWYCGTARSDIALPDPVDCLQKPSPPVYTKQEFYKRPPQFNEVWEALQQPGARVLVHGAPGLGKTAMVNVLAQRFWQVCHSRNTAAVFCEVWHGYVTTCVSRNAIEAFMLVCSASIS